MPARRAGASTYRTAAVQPASANQIRHPQRDHGTTTSLAPPSERRLKAALAALRPHQWTKNALLWVAPLFSRTIVEPEIAYRTALGFGAYCLLASGVYVLNDLRDRDRDRLHPAKHRRPFASGDLAPSTGIAMAAVCLLAGAALAAALGRSFAGTAAFYLLVTLGYNAGLKDVPGLELLLLATGYVLRVLAGAAAARVPPSPWLLAVAGTSALLLATGKRRSEMALLSADRQDHRPCLAAYTLPFLDRLLALAAATTVGLYTAYSLLVPAARLAHIILTLPAVAVGLARYLQLMWYRAPADETDRQILTDPVLLAAGAAWLVLSAALLLT